MTKSGLNKLFPGFVIYYSGNLNPINSPSGRENIIPLKTGLDTHKKTFAVSSEIHPAPDFENFLSSFLENPSALRISSDSMVSSMTRPENLIFGNLKFEVSFGKI